MGHSGQLGVDVQNEQRRSARLAVPNLNPHRSGWPSAEFQALMVLKFGF
jgi:hypothetical protein